MSETTVREADLIKRMQHIAWYEVYRDHNSVDQFLVLCIVITPEWRFLAEKIKPDSNIDAILERGNMPILVISEDWSICNDLIARDPGLGVMFAEHLGNGKVTGLIIDSEGVTALNIVPEKPPESYH